MKRNFTQSEFDLIATTLNSQDFNVEWIKSGNIRAKVSGTEVEYIFYKYPDGRMMIRRKQPNLYYLGCTSIWPLFRNSRTNTYKYFDNVYSMMAKFVDYWIKMNF